MREQPVKTGARRAWMPVLTAILLTAVLAAAVVFEVTRQPPYKPPPFESAAELGIPNPPKSFGYGVINAMGNFKFGLAGVTYQQEDGSLRVYLTNPENNEAYLMCEVVDPDGKTLYKSGLLRPGEFVVSLYPVTKLENEAVNIEIKIYALDPERFYSIGMVTLDNILQPY